MRIGFGFDVHPWEKDRDLVLGGVKIPYHMGLKGHSDADCLLHAIADALLGASSSGDLGKHFPESEEKYKDISSLVILEEVRTIVGRQGMRIKNIDCVCVVENPKISGYVPLMKQNISRALKMPENNVNIEATTQEGLGFIGRGEGIGCYAVALLELGNVRNL